MAASKKNASVPKRISSAEIRQSFLGFFAAHGHTIVPSSPLVPANDPTLLFSNAGMVQFKDVFLGTGSRRYTRAVDSQKCMRVAGKHNDLEDVGRDNIHHTFFEMLGNWSFGDYYKEDAITWAWQLLTEVWGLPKDRIWATCFEDELNEIPRDDEAAEIWRRQPGFNPSHLLFFGREENFWEMAETGPCGPDSEIHFDLGPECCDLRDVPDHACRVNGDCARYLELWNLVFIQYNRHSPTQLDPLPAKHVDTGMGLERIVSLLQGVDSNYKTDLFTPLFDRIQQLAGHSDSERDTLLTPYRVISDHVRAASFLIADGVVPGNTGRNYVCRMIIRRASRFGSHAGFEEPFLAHIAEVVVDHYGKAYPELVRNRAAIMTTITDEEERFQRTVEAGVAHLEQALSAVRGSDGNVLSGAQAFDLYATYGLPLEITRDIARETGMEVDEPGFLEALESHRLASGAGQGALAESEADVQVFLSLFSKLQEQGKLGAQGVAHDPYTSLRTETNVLALVHDGRLVEKASAGETVAVVLQQTPFYVEAGGQVSDTGMLVSAQKPGWEIEIREARQPVSGMIAHHGKVMKGKPAVGDNAIAVVDDVRRLDIMRNHTATHLLHAALRSVLGDHARQAGSLVAPDRLRFDFTHPKALSSDEIARIEQQVNQAILANHHLETRMTSREEAISEGAMALFGETYGDTVRTVRIGADDPLSLELCGGTHVPETSAIGPFVIVSEGSVAAGIRRLEALTGRGAQAMIQSRLRSLNLLAQRLGASVDDLDQRLEGLLQEKDHLTRELNRMREHLAVARYEKMIPREVAGVKVLTGVVPEVTAETLRHLADRFRNEHATGVVVLGSAPEGQPILVAGISSDLVKKGLHAGELIKEVAEMIGGSGGGKPTLAQAGGKDASRLENALELVDPWVESRIG